MKKTGLLLLIVISACQYNDLPTNTCDVRDPASDLPWLKEKIQEIQQTSIHQYFRVEQVEYNGEIGFYINSCCPLCDIQPIFYKCSGEAVINIDISKLIRKGIIWQPLDFSCAEQ
jgi:hypothetical protein